MFKLILYRVFQLFVTLPVMVVATVVAGLITVLGSWLGSSRWWGYWPPHYWARICLAVSLVKIKVKGRGNIDKDTSYVFVANHQGAYDIFAVYGYLNHNFKWMMKKELLKFPIVGFSCAAAGHIFVDNSSPAAVRQTMAKAESTLQRGMSLVVFPEGARSWDGKMRRFKRGAYMLAVEFGLPVVPITIDGSFDIMPRFKKLPVWGHITLTIHKPIEAIGGTHDLPSLMDSTYEAIHSSLPPKYQ